MSEKEKENYSPIVAGDKMKITLSRMRGEKIIDEEGYALLWWLWSHMVDHNMSYSGAADMIGMSTATVNRVLNGKYGAGLASVVDAIREAKRKREHEEAQANIGFIETTVWQEINDLLTLIHSTRQAGFIFGPLQIGKTEALEEFCRRNGPAIARLIRIPARCHFTYLIDLLCLEFNISLNLSLNIKRAKILDALDPSMILIFDEVHQLIESTPEAACRTAVEYIREIHDRKKCAVAICATSIFDTEMRKGRLAAMLKQLSERGLPKVRLDPKPRRADINKIIRYFGLALPTGDTANTVNDLVKDHSLGALFRYMTASAVKAQNDNEKLSWKHFEQYHELLQSMAEEDSYNAEGDAE